MDYHSVREELIERLNTLTDEQVEVLLQVIRMIHPAESSIPYDEASDPAIGMIEGPTDLARRAKEILREEIDPRSGWTQKDQL